MNAREGQLGLALTADSHWQTLPLAQAEVSFCPSWLDASAADALFNALLNDIPWETHRIRMFGREVDSPRRSCWIGDPGTGYTYSRTRFEPHAWPDALAQLRAKLASACGAPFNSVLANLYRDGNDSMGWHSDNEPELGRQPVIASLSLGASRRFRLKPRAGITFTEHAATSADLSLVHGSLLRMAGDTQRFYQHAVPKTRRADGPRINLTFRVIHSR